MMPTLKLGPWDSPSIELMPCDIEPLVILLIQNNSPLTKEALDSVWCLLEHDTLFLDAASVDFFAKLQAICHQVASGQITKFEPSLAQNSEFDGYLRRHMGDGSITLSVRSAARRFLDFLNNHPSRWPPPTAG